MSCSSSQGKCFNLFPFQYYVDCELVIDYFYYIEVCLLYADFAENLNHKKILDFGPGTVAHACNPSSLGGQAR